MNATYTATISHTPEWWIGWVNEVPGVNAQAHTREELIDNLRECLAEMLEIYRQDAIQAAAECGNAEEVLL